MEKRKNARVKAKKSRQKLRWKLWERTQSFKKISLDMKNSPFFRKKKGVVGMRI